MRIRVKSLTALLFAMWPVSTTAQVTEQWVARYDGPYNGPDYVKAIAVDQTTGNVYVTGQSWGGNPANAYTTVAYDSRGNQLWLARYSGPGNLDDRASAIAVDSATGNIYVTGESWGGGSSSDWDYATVAYDSNGNQLWVARYNGPGNSRDSATAIAVGGDGNVYVTGWSWGGDSKVDYATVAYDSGGSQLWVARYNGPGNGDDYALAIAVDVGDNVYVTGYSWGGSSDYDYATVAYDSAGNQLWVARYNGPENGIDQATAIAVDNSTRNVYVTGGSSRGFAFLDFATVAYDLDGNQLWVKRYHGPGNGRDIARAIAVDAGGNVYVTGESWESASGSAYATIAYDSSGNPLWIARYNGPANGTDRANAMVIDNSGHVCVTGQSWDSPSASAFATVAYDSSGNQLWVARYNGPVSGYDGALAIAADSKGNVYVTGASWGGPSDFDYATIMYSQP